MKSDRKSITPFYALIQILYWSSNCMMFSYASVYLQSWNFNNSQIGLLLGTAYALAAVIQPIIASVFNRHRICMSSGMACLEGFVALIALSILLVPGGKLAVAVRMAMILMLHHGLQPVLNSLQRGYEMQGLKVNFSLARGIGSAAFSLTSFTMGQLLKRFIPRLIPAFYLGVLALLIIALFFFRSPSFTAEEKKDGSGRDGSLLRRYPRFALFLLALILLSTCDMYVSNFMLQIMQSIGVGSAEMGIAVAMTSFVELPSMALYTRMRRKIDPRILLTASFYIWTLRMFVIFLAKSPVVIYATALMNFGSYALYLPSMVDYLLITLPEKDFLSGQALNGTAFTMGSLIAMILGGRMLDKLGMHLSLGIFLIPAAISVVIITLVVPDWKNSRLLGARKR